MKQILLWYLAGALAAIAVGWLAARLNLVNMAPVGILSLAVGAALGAILASIAAFTSVPHHKHLIVGTVLLALLTVVAQHAWLYRDFRRQWHEARTTSPEVALFRPEDPWSPAEYFSRELTPSGAALWGLDALLVTAAAIGAVAVRRRQFKQVGP